MAATGTSRWVVAVAVVGLLPWLPAAASPDEDLPTAHLQAIVVDEAAGLVDVVLDLHGAPADSGGRVRTVAGTATSGVDYEPVDETFDLDVEGPNVIATLHVHDDGIDEPVEAFELEIVALHGAAPGTTRVAVELHDGDTPALSTTFADLEESSGRTTVPVPLRLDHPDEAQVVLDWETRAGLRATPGEDYVEASGRVVFPPGTTTRTVDVEVVGDTRPEPYEQVLVVATDATGVMLPQRGLLGVVSIFDDDGAFVWVEDGPVVAAPPARWAHVHVSHQGATDDDGPILLDWRTVDGTAIAGRDHVARDLSVELQPHESTTLAVPLLDPPGGSTTARSLVVELSSDDAPVLRERVEIVIEPRPGADEPYDGSPGPDGGSDLPIGDPVAPPPVGGYPDDVDVPPGLEILAGATRDDSSVAVSRRRFPEPASADEVVLASGLGHQGWADALTGAALAARRRAPLLLVRNDHVPDVVLWELERVLRPGGRITLLGGLAAIDRDVESLLAVRWSVQRISGADRVATSLAVAEAHGTPAVVLVTAGHTFADALAAGAVAARDGGVVLLTTPDEPSPTVTAYLERHREVPTYAVGGPAARAFPGLVPVFGGDREATSVAVAEQFFASGSTVGLARSDVPIDALAAGPLMGELGGPLLLTPSMWLHDAVDTWVCEASTRLDDGFVFGGSVAVEEPVVQGFADRLAGSCATPAGTRPPEDRVAAELDASYPPGGLSWELHDPPEGFELRLAYPRTARDQVSIVASICNVTDQTRGVDLMLNGKGDKSLVVGMGVSSYDDVRAHLEREAEDPEPPPIRSAGVSRFIEADDALVTGMAPGACRDFTWAWDLTLGPTTDGPRSGRAEPGRWLLDVRFHLREHEQPGEAPSPGDEVVRGSFELRL